MATDGSGDGSGGALTLKDRVQAMISDISKFKDSYQQNIKFIEDEKETIMHVRFISSLNIFGFHLQWSVNVFIGINWNKI